MIGAAQQNVAPVKPRVAAVGIRKRALRLNVDPLDRTEVILGVAPLFPCCQQVPRLTAGASFALVVSQACVPTCPEYMSPCPKPFDVAALVWRHELPA